MKFQNLTRLLSGTLMLLLSLTPVRTFASDSYYDAIKNWRGPALADHHDDYFTTPYDHEHEHGEEVDEDDYQLKGIAVDIKAMLACKKASSTQLSLVNEGNRKLDAFLKGCAKATNNSAWCAQLVRPNPDSKNTFACTYGSRQTHQLIHPDRTTWGYSYKGVQLVEELQKNKIKVKQIYNWWRPEPYNANVGGAAARHPYATSIDVKLSTYVDRDKAHKYLCARRKLGHLRALGTYAGTGIHIGVGDKTANTWGMRCNY